MAADDERAPSSPDPSKKELQMAARTQEDARRERKASGDRLDAAYMAERRRIEAANSEKTARLRALRLQKEASEREAAEKEAADRAANPTPTKSRMKKTAL